MKNKFIAFSVIALAFASAAKAQNTADVPVTAYAEIVAPITISKGQEVTLNFGSIVRTTSGGTVVLSPEGQATYTGVAASAGTGAVHTAAAQITISGEVGYTYTVTLPGDDEVVLKSSTGGEDMSVTTFSHNASGSFAEGSETFKVGATLHVNALQAPGQYVSDPFNVTVAYN